MKERNAFFSNVGLYMKLALVTLLMIGGSNYAWGDEVTIYNSESPTTNTNVPVAGYYMSSGASRSQFIIPESEIYSLQNQVITKLTFYGNAETADWGATLPSFKVYMKRIAPETTTLSAFLDWESLETVYSGTVSVSNYKMVITLDTPFLYEDDNILIGFYRTSSSTKSSTYYWYGESQNSNKTAWVQTSTSGTGYSVSFLPKMTITTTSTPKPNNFSIEAFTNTTATFGWENGYNETAWEISYCTGKADFNPDDEGNIISVTTNPYTLTSLVENATYYASIRAKYGVDNYSDWTDIISVTPQTVLSTLKNDGTGTSYYVPFSGNSVKTVLSQSQFIIPQKDLADMKNRQITCLTFYTNKTSGDWGKAKFEVYLKETANTTFTTSTYESWGTKVFNSASISPNASGEITIILDTPFNYTTGNLMIGFKQTEYGTNSSCYFYSIRPTGNCAIYGSSGTATNYAPKVTITSISPATAPVQLAPNGYTTFASHLPLDLTAAKQAELGVTAYRATVDMEIGKVRFTQINQTVPANTGILLEGTGNTTYAIPVVASGDALAGNEFLVNTKGGTFAADDGYTYFGLKKATESTDPVIFGTFTPGTVAIPSNKAYLKVLTSSLPAARELKCVFDDGQTTGISDASHLTDNGKMRNDNFFNLNGQRVAQPIKGLYIKNGKKVVMK